MIIGMGIGIGFPQALGGGFVGALDGLSVSAAAAYSTRKLRSAYAGSAIRVRRSFDNAEADIGFTAAGDLDTTALLAFVQHGGPGPGNEDGFVTTFYDQSGNGRNVGQVVAASQPRIVNAGVVDTLGGRPSVVFDGVTDILVHNAAFLYAAGASTSLAVLSGASQINRFIVAEGSSTNLNPIYSTLQSHVSIGTSSSRFIRNSSGLIILSNADAATSGAFDGTARVLTHVDTGSNFSGFLNGTAAFSTNYTRSGTLPMDRFAVGGLQRATTSFPFVGAISEIIVVPSALSTADRQTLERNQGAAYGITVA